MASRPFPDFKRAVEQLTQRGAVGKTHRILHLRVIAETYRDLIRRSPVDTGAYRASHAIVEGASRKILYDAPSRPDPDEVITRGSLREAENRRTTKRTKGGRVLIEPPSEPEARAALLADLQPFSRVEIENRRYYAGFLEYGTANMAPRAIYATAAIVADNQAKSENAKGLDLSLAPVRRSAD